MNHTISLIDFLDSIAHDLSPLASHLIKKRDSEALEAWRLSVEDAQDRGVSLEVPRSLTIDGTIKLYDVITPFVG